MFCVEEHSSVSFLLIGAKFGHIACSSRTIWGDKFGAVVSVSDKEGAVFNFLCVYGIILKMCFFSLIKKT